MRTPLGGWIEPCLGRRFPIQWRIWTTAVLCAVSHARVRQATLCIQGVWLRLQQHSRGTLQQRTAPCSHTRPKVAAKRCLSRDSTVLRGSTLAARLSMRSDARCGLRGLTGACTRSEHGTWCSNRPITTRQIGIGIAVVAGEYSLTEAGGWDSPLDLWRRASGAFAWCQHHSGFNQLGPAVLSSVRLHSIVRQRAQSLPILPTPVLHLPAIVQPSPTAISCGRCTVLQCVALHNTAAAFISCVWNTLVQSDHNRCYRRNGGLRQA